MGTDKNGNKASATFNHERGPLLPMTAAELLEYGRLRWLDEADFLVAWRDVIASNNKAHLYVVELAAVVRYLSFSEAVQRLAAQFPDSGSIPTRPTSEL